MNYQTIITESQDHTLTITLNRPDVRNAFNEELIAELAQVCSREAADDDIRLVFIKGAGKVFSAGGDLQWMKQSASRTRDENRDDALKLGQMLDSLNRLNKPVVGLVHGAALGGGMGLVSVCDYVMASKDTLFGLTEARLGLIPAVIGPFVINKIGESHARALFLTAEMISAERAYQIGLVHQIVESAKDFAEAGTNMQKIFFSLSPQALRTAKKFIFDLKKKPDSDKIKFAAQTLADLRVTEEAQEGIRAFLEKRKPKW